MAETGARAGANEGELVKRLIDRDESAFVALVERYHEGLKRVALTFVRSPSSADEVVQETWRAFLEGLESFKKRSSLKTFLYRILANIARTRAVRDRRMTNESELESADDDSPLADRFGLAGQWLAPPTAWSAETADAILERKQAMRQLLRALEKLPEQQRAVVQLRDVEGLSSEEVCALLDLSEVHQRVLLHRARTKLRAALDAHFRG